MYIHTSTTKNGQTAVEVISRQKCEKMRMDNESKQEYLVFRVPSTKQQQTGLTAGTCC